MAKAKKASKPSSSAKPYDASKRKKQTSSKGKDAASSTSSSGKSNEPFESYLLLVRLNSTYDPSITRLLSVPSNFTFKRLHEVLQAAFGWTDSHDHAFWISELPGKDKASKFMGRGKLIFSLHRDDGDLDDPEMSKKESDFTLANVFDGEEYRDKVMVQYEYDMGDGWEHSITFLGRAQPSMRKAMGIPEDIQAFCLAGEGHPCAEDCGGSSGWQNLKEIFTKKGKKDPDGLKQWYKGSDCGNGDPKGLDPYKWDILDVNDILQQIKT